MEKKNTRVLIIGLTWPQPQATAAGVRMVQIISLLKSQDYQITFSSAASVPSPSEFPGIPGVDFKAIRLNHDSFDTFLFSLNPTIVIFDRFQTEEYFGWRVARTAPQALRILDTEDLHSLRMARGIALQKGIPFHYSQWKKLDITRREIASLFRSDLSLIISRFEMDWLKTHVPALAEQLFYLPFLFGEEDLLPRELQPAFEDRNGYVFLGNGRHLPNIDAIRYLKDEVWPLIRKALPDASVSVYGANLPREISALSCREEGFLVKGWVPDVEGVLKSARVNLVPLRFGAGLKGKLFDAIRCGTPSALTPVAAEGTAFASLGEHIGDDPDEFASIAVSLYRNKTLWENLQKISEAIIKSDFSRSEYVKELQVKLDFISKQLPEWREDNLIGAMLLHHTMASSKYLSKWIGLKEEKAGEAP